MERKLAGTLAVILAGGLGTRLRPAVSNCAKVLAEVDGRPFIRFVLDRLSALGVKSVVLCTGYKGLQLQETLGESHGELRIEYSREPSPLGTAGALRQALPRMGADPVLVLNGDSFCTGDIREFFDWHCEKGAAASLMLVHQEDTSDYGRVETDSDGHVVAFREKSNEGQPGWINAGIYILPLELIESIPAGRAVSIEKEMFPAWISHGLNGFQSDGELIDIGTPERYAAAPEFFKALTEKLGGRGTP